MLQRRRIYLMRHGEVHYFTGAGPNENQISGELTARGREQAIAAGRALQDATVDRVVVSNLPRTAETARLVLEAMGASAPLEAWPEFEELMGHIPEGLTEDRIDAEFLPIFHGIPAHEDRFLGGESVGELVARVNDAFERLLEQDWHTLLLVLHGAVNRVILSRALTNERAFFGHIEQSPGCFNIIDVGENLFVRAVNTTPLDLGHKLRMTSIEELAADYRAYIQTMDP